MADISKIRLSGVTYNIVDDSAVHSLADYSTTEQMNSAITAATTALAEAIAEEGYQNATQVSDAIDAAISGKADTTAVTASIEAATSGKADTTAVTQSIEAAVSGKADTTAVTNSLAAKYGAVEYDSNSKRINFYADSTTGTVLSYVDATDFIKDGMVDNVEIKTITNWSEEIEAEEGTYNIPSDSGTVKTFKFEYANLEDGNTISFGDGVGAYIELTYTIGEWNEFEYDDVHVSMSGNEITVECGADQNIASISYVTISSSMNPSNFYAYYEGTYLAITFNSDAGKEEIDILLNDIFNPNNYYTKEDVDAKIEVALSDYVDNSTYETYTAATATALSGKQNTLSAGTGIEIDANNTISVTGVPLTVEDEVTSGSSNPVKSSGIYNAITAATATKQDTLVSGTNIKTVGTESILGSGNIQTLKAEVGTGNDSTTLILTYS